MKAIKSELYFNLLSINEIVLSVSSISTMAMNICYYLIFDFGSADSLMS